MAITTTQGSFTRFVTSTRYEAVALVNCTPTVPSVCTTSCTERAALLAPILGDVTRWGKKQDLDTPWEQRKCKAYYTHKCDVAYLIQPTYSTQVTGSTQCMYKGPTGLFYRYKTVSQTLTGLRTAHPLFVNTASAFSYHPEPRVDPNLLNDAYKKLYEHLLDEKINIGQELATLLQTSNMVMEIGLGLSKVLRCFSNRNLKKAYRTVRREMRHLYNTPELRSEYTKRFSKKVSQSWLQLYYGVQPLVISSKGLIELAKDQTARPLVFSCGSGKMKAYDWNAPTEVQPSGNYEHKYPVGPKKENLNYSQLQVNTYWQMQDPMTAFQKQIGFDTANILYVAYDLTKWSFLFNWVVDIGSYLNEFRAIRDLTYVDGCYTVKVFTQSDSRRAVVTSTLDTSGWGSCKSYTFKRVPLPTRPSPSIGVRNPFYNSFNYANAVALIFGNVKNFRLPT